MPFSRSSNFFVVTHATVLSCPFQSSHGGAYGQERLENYWADDDGQGFVAFQRKHRFDKNTMKDWQDYVRALFPRKKVGLILDRSSIRSFDYMDKLGFIVEFILAGMTGIK